MNRGRADALLFLVALLWGTTFVAQKTGNAYVGPIFFVAVRFLAAAVFLLPIAAWEARRRPAALARADLIAAGCIGACLCAACWLQQIGMESTTATNAGFLTAVYMVLVPFVAWAFSRRPPRLLVLLAGAVALYGAWLLGGDGHGAQWSRGDLLILASDLIWATHITLIGHFRGIAGRPVLLSFLQCALTGLVSLPPALLWQPATLAALGAALPAIVYAGIVSSGIAFTLQIMAQRHTPAAEAALIMSLESVFAAVAGALLLQETLSLQATVGAFLILTGVVLVETGPLLTRPAPLRE
ncbi:putative transporter protein [Burkholderiales bacterium]|jgi:drug/metabolite transporter (DMT)-like permease|nr:putative transporter protein [Burkholderiales bacterium]